MQHLNRRKQGELEIHYTPKHGSWLDMAEIAAWQEQRNHEAICVNWRFTTKDARVKLRSLYPSIQC